MDDYFVSADQSMLDLDFVVRSLQSTYWAGERPREVIIGSLANSVCFGVYETKSKQQVGFARVVTDNLVFSWLADVFVAPEHRGHGLGKRLVAAALSHPRVSRTKVHLGTRDAHGLYEQFGFERWEGMRRLPRPDDGELI